MLYVEAENLINTFSKYWLL